MTNSRQWNLSTLFLVHACSWKALIRISAKRCSSGLVLMPPIQVNSSLSLMVSDESTITQPAVLAGARDTEGARGYFWVEKFWYERLGGFRVPLLRDEGDANNSMFLLTLLLDSFQCKVRKTFNSAKMR